MPDHESVFGDRPSVRCRLFGHKFKQGGQMRGKTEPDPGTNPNVTRTRSYLWCFRCERWFPGSVEIPTTRRFP